MEQFIYDVLIGIAVYIGIIILVFIALDFMSAKFLRTWFRVKTSQGSKILVRVLSKVQDFYRAGWIEEGFLIFKGSNKEKRRVVLPENAIYRSAGVNCVAVDDEKNAVLKANLDAVTGFDAEKFDDLITRALYKPSLMDDKTKIIIVILIVLVLGLGLGFYLTHGWIVASQEALTQQIAALAELAKPVGEVAANNIAGG